jgi:hypothetical protein
LKVAGSLFVTPPLARFGVASTVELDPNSSLVAEEVENVGSDRMLPAKLEAGQTTSPKALPE